MESQLNNVLQKLFMKACSCDGRAVHSHCRVEKCGRRIQLGEWHCPECEDLASRTKWCIRCAEQYVIPASGPAQFQQTRDLCSERCLEGCVRAELAAAGVGARYVRCTLQTFDVHLPSLSKKLQRIRNWSESRLTNGLLLFGKVGSGKTHLAVGAMRELLLRGKTGLFVNGRRFVLRCQASFGADEAIEDIVEEYLSAHFLVIDDLCSEKSTDFARQCLLELVDRAYAQGHTLIVTTNLDFRGLNFIEPRLASRLAEMCVAIKFDEPDYRITLARRRTNIES